MHFIFSRLFPFPKKGESRSGSDHGFQLGADDKSCLGCGLDLLYGGVTAVVKPRGKLSGAVLAHIAVFQLAVAQQADLAAADGADLLLQLPRFPARNSAM